ncbi:MAG TPA: STAS domain-containing protein [Solirubrobacteraceae bacterium]|nr:STAS domain-containing protein [Solirubrobacteraceae bacterium]
MGVQDQLRIDIRTEAGRAVLSLDGELDMANAPLFQSALDDAQLASVSTVVFDLQQLQFIDSTGLRIILATRERCRERGQEFAITPGSDQVQRLLSVTGVGEHLRTVATPGELLV